MASGLSWFNLELPHLDMKIGSGKNLIILEIIEIAVTVSSVWFMQFVLISTILNPVKLFWII